MKNSSSTAEESKRREVTHTERLVLILGLAAFIVMADNWVVSPILPAISKTLQIQPALVMVSEFSTSIIIVAYSIKDLFFIYGLALFTVSAMAPFAISEASQAIQEIGSA